VANNSSTTPENFENMAVGHAGLYTPETDDQATEVFQTIAEIQSVITEAITPDIPLGLKGAGQTLINCEKGIKSFVKDVLAKDRGNGLPDSETGVWVHYLTEGIAKDFGRTWEDTPVSLRSKQSKEDKKLSAGKRVITKKEKNELLDKLNITHYQKDIDEGRMTLREAMESIEQAYAYKKKLEDAGYYLSPNKTEGVSLHNWEQMVYNLYDTWDAIEVYKTNKIEVVLPDVMNNFFLAEPNKVKIKFIEFALKNVAIANGAWAVGSKRSPRKFGAYDPNDTSTDKADYYNKRFPRPTTDAKSAAPLMKGGVEKEPITSMDDLLTRLPKGLLPDDFNIKLVSLGKLLPMSRSDCYIIFDGVDKKNGRMLYLSDGNSVNRIKDQSYIIKDMQERLG